jgi:hypothetical protein
MSVQQAPPTSSSSQLYPVIINGTYSQHMDLQQIAAWNADPARATDGKTLSQFNYLGSMQWADSTTINAYSSSQASASAALWAGYPDSDRVFFTYLSTMPRPQVSGSGGDVNIINAMLDQVNERPCLSNINAIITEYNRPLTKYTTGETINLNLVPYTSEDQIATMFNTASANGESSLSKTDKVILRIFTYLSVDFYNMLKQIYKSNPSLIDKYSPTSQGLCPWSEAVFAQTGQNVKTNIINILNLAKQFNGTDSTIANITLLTDNINSVLPPGMEPIDPSKYLKNIVDVTTKNVKSTPQIQSFIWFIKYITAGPMYSWWVAKNVWKLNTNFDITA